MVSGQYDANIGLVLIYGFIIAIPTVIIAGPLYTKLARRITPSAFEQNKGGTITVLADLKQYKLGDIPSFGISAFTALFQLF